MNNEIIILDNSCEIFYDQQTSGNWYYTIGKFGVKPKTNSIVGDTIEYETVGLTEIVLNVSDIVEVFTNWYNDRFDTNFEFTIDEEFQELEINQGLYHVKPEIEKAFEQAYITEETRYNTDIIVYKDGSVSTNNYFGSICYRDSCIEFVYSVTSQMKQSFNDWIRDGLNEEQKEYCDNMGWLSMWQTNSDNKEDWEEFSIEDIDWRDTWDYFVEKYEDSLCY